MADIRWARCWCYSTGGAGSRGCCAIRSGYENGRLRGGQLDGGRFVYSGNYKATGLYEFAWVTTGLGAAVESFFGLSTKEAYFFGVESFGFEDKNGDQVLCVRWLGANPGTPDYILSVIDNNAAS
jgi:hypothetical protein